MQDNLFFNTAITPFEILEQLYREAAIDSNYYNSPVEPPVTRCDVSQGVRDYFKKILSVPFRDCGFLKTPPNSVYPIHRDTLRTTALNMLIVDVNTDFETFIWNITHNAATQYTVPYVKDQFTIINVMNPHGVINKSKNLHRIVLSIGITDYDYATILNLHKENKLFNFT